MEDLAALVRAARRGDGDAFGRIVRRFQDIAFAGAYARLGDVHLAQDAAQDAFVEAYLGLERLREAAAFPGWFRRIVAKHCDRQRRKRPPVAAPAAVEALQADLPGADQVLERRGRHGRLHRALEDLPPRQREAVALFYIEDRSLKETARYLEVPVNTVKKRLFDARKGLRERMLEMTAQTLKDNRPSKDSGFADRVAFFTALRAGDLERIKELARRDDGLLRLRTRWPFGGDGYFPPHGLEPLAWAASVGDLPLLEFLLESGIAPDSADEGSRPLVHAARMCRAEAARRLLDAGAEPGSGPLRVAAMRGCVATLRLLLDAGADPARRDDTGRTPADWASLRGHADAVDLLVRAGAPAPIPPEAAPPAAPPARRRISAGEASLGRFVDGSGRARDGGGALQTGTPLPYSAGEPFSPVLPTGIKVIDLLCPLRRGGQSGLFTPTAGVGKIVVLTQVLHDLAALHGARVVYAALERGPDTARELRLCWEAAGIPRNILDKRMAAVLCPEDADGAGLVEAAETALGLAADLRRDGGPVLLAVEEPLAQAAGVGPMLRAGATDAPDAWLSVLRFGHRSAGIEAPDTEAGLEAFIAFDRARADQGLYPAIDPLRSRSALLDASLAAADHVETADRVRRCLRRYADLHNQFENAGFDALAHLHDRQAAEETVIRARRLHRFLTQPFVGFELFTDTPGQRVPLAETLKGCRAILDGQCDEVPEEAFHFVGTLEQALDKAKSL